MMVEKRNLNEPVGESTPTKKFLFREELERALLLFLGLIFFLTRFATLNWHSPWVDELANWEIALSDNWTSVSHPLTYWILSHFISFNDQSIGLLRLPSAIFWTLGSIYLIVLIWRSLGRTVAVLCAFFLTFSPFALNFSQDANHYHFLFFSAIGAISIPFILFAEKRFSPTYLSVAIFLTVVGFFAHLLVAISIISAVGSIGLALALQPELIRRLFFLQDKHLRNVRLLGLVVFLGGLAFLMQIGFYHHIPGAGINSGFSLSPEYQLKLFGDLVGRLHHHTWLDMITGIIGLAIALSGFAACWHRFPHHKFFAATAITFFVYHYAFFGLFEYRHMIYAKFFTPLLPVLIIGWCLFFRYLFRLSSPRHVKIPAIFFILVFFASGVAYQHTYFQRPYMEYRGMVIALEKIMTDKDQVVTYKHFHSRATSFYLNHLRADANINYTPLTFGQAAQMPSFIQQIREKADEVSAQGGKLFFWYYQDGEHMFSPYALFLEQETEHLLTLPSRAPSDLNIIRRDMHLVRVKNYREVGRPNAFDTPRAAVAASARFPFSHTEPRQVDGLAFLSVHSGGSAIYRLRQPEEPISLFGLREFENSPDHLLLLINENLLYQVDLSEMPPANMFEVPLPPLPDDRPIHHLSVISPLQYNKRANILLSSIQASISDENPFVYHPKLVESGLTAMTRRVPFEVERPFVADPISGKNHRQWMIGRFEIRGEDGKGFVWRLHPDENGENLEIYRMRLHINGISNYHQFPVYGAMEISADTPVENWELIGQAYFAYSLNPRWKPSSWQLFSAELPAP